MKPFQTAEPTETVENILGDYLKPPKQDYEALARKLAKLTGKQVTPIVTYFRLFASGYAFWQEDYNYPRVYQYFYGAYLSAREDEKTKPEYKDLNHFFYLMTRAMIYYTGCENALICNSMYNFYHNASLAREYIEKASDVFDNIEKKLLTDGVREPIRIYLDMNIALFNGFEKTGEIYLQPYQPLSTPELDQLNQDVQEHLEGLQKDSLELYSELKAHYSFATRLYKAYQTQSYGAIRVTQATLILRAIGYLDPRLVSAAFSEHAKNQKTMPKDACEKTGLPIDDIFTIELNDAFSTKAGLQRHLDSLVFEIDSEGLGFSFYEGNELIHYEFSSFNVAITRYGSISVDLELTIDPETHEHGFSVAHLRTLESLLGPHIGWMKIGWTNAPTELNADQAESIDFVTYLLNCRDWLETAKQNNYIPKSEDKAIEKLEVLLKEWEQELKELAIFLRKAWLESLDTEEDDDKYEFINEQLTKVREFMSDWKWLAKTEQDETLEEFKDELRSLFPESGVSFGRLMTIAEDALVRLADYSKALAGLDDSKETILHFDPDVNWQSILIATEIAQLTPEGLKTPFTVEEYQALMEHPEFKGLLLGSREARAAIDDWMFVSSVNLSKNLAPIRSHITDMLVVDNNRAFIYMPDDPDFIISQYDDTCRLIGDLRAYLMGHQVILKELIYRIDEKLDDGEEIPDEMQKEIYQKLRQAERAIDIAVESTFTRYSDHSHLFKAMLEQSSVLELQDLLGKNVRRLQRYLDYLKHV
jgi:hypothetical protein